MHDLVHPQKTEHQEPQEHNRAKSTTNDLCSKPLENEQQHDDTQHQAYNKVITRHYNMF